MQYALIIQRIRHQLEQLRPIAGALHSLNHHRYAEEIDPLCYSRIESALRSAMNKKSPRLMAAQMQVAIEQLTGSLGKSNQSIWPLLVLLSLLSCLRITNPRPLCVALLTLLQAPAEACSAPVAQDYLALLLSHTDKTEILLQENIQCLAQMITDAEQIHPLTEQAWIDELMQALTVILQGLQAWESKADWSVIEPLQQTFQCLTVAAKQAGHEQYVPIFSHVLEQLKSVTPDNEEAISQALAHIDELSRLIPSIITEGDVCLELPFCPDWPERQRHVP